MFFFLITEKVVGHPSQQFVFKIYSNNQATPLEVAAESESELNDWIAAITKCIENAARRVCYYIFTQTCGAFCNSLKFIYRFLFYLQWSTVLSSTPFLFRLKDAQ